MLANAQELLSVQAFSAFRVCKHLPEPHTSQLQQQQLCIHLDFKSAISSQSNAYRTHSQIYNITLYSDQRMRFTLANGSGAAFGAGFAGSGVPNTFQNRNVSSPAAEATVHPSGLCHIKCSKKRGRNIRRLKLLKCSKKQKLQLSNIQIKNIYLSHEKNSGSMPSKLCHFRHGGVLPQCQLVLRKSM